jgi:hypothetical protein
VDSTPSGYIPEGATLFAHALKGAHLDHVGVSQVLLLDALRLTQFLQFALLAV